MESDLEQEVSIEEQIENLLENQEVARVILCFLDIRFIHELVNLRVPKELVNQYRRKNGDLVKGNLSEPLKKIFVKYLNEKKDLKKLKELAAIDGLAGDCLDQACRLENEVAMLKLLFENLVHGAYEIPWEYKFEISDTWQVIVRQAPVSKN